MSEIPIIEMKNVHKTFGTRKILKGVDVVVNKGETMVILGPSGTGKSVTLKHITGLVAPDEGGCLILGESIAFSKEKVREKLRAKMGVLFQSGALIKQHLYVSAQLMSAMELHQCVNGLQDKHSRLHSTFFQNNFYNILKVVSYRTNEMDR